MNQPPGTDSPSGLEKVSSGIKGLDEITAGGLPRGRPTLVCGNAGCGKTLSAAEFFEESRNQLIRNMRSIGVDLEPHVKEDLLRFDMARPTRHGLEMHLARMHKGMSHSNQIREFLLTDRGIQLVDVYLGPEGVLTGSARVALEARRKTAALERHEEIARRKVELERKRKEVQSKDGEAR